MDIWCFCLEFFLTSRCLWPVSLLRLRRFRLFEVCRDSSEQPFASKHRRPADVAFASCRDEDRAILMELKAKGPSRRTFSALSKKLKKPSDQVGRLPLLPGPAVPAAAEADADLCVLLFFIFFFQIAQRFHQLMKLYQKQGKADTWSSCALGSMEVVYAMIQMQKGRAALRVGSPSL